MQDSRVKLRRVQVSSFVLRWILAVALTFSALMAQVPPASKLKIIVPERDGAGNALQRIDNSIVGPSILLALPSKGAVSAFPNRAQTTARPPGRTYGTTIGVLVVAGAAVAGFLAFSGKGGKRSITAIPPAGPVGTIITAGTPTVNPPPNQ